MKDKPVPKKTNLWRSVGAALLGVQSDHSRRQDFSQPSALPFILAGLAAIVLFVGMLVIISRFVAG
ncbi:DUF2970 domain-containing protein [Photobacterium sp. SP02]|uniref:DUF2970 domain-containing protein n=1 Tax=unclassified Photobacterium TaxID=2628852 RepID=UPI00301E11A8